MNPLKSLLLAISIISGSAGASAAQVIIGVQPKAQEQGNGLNVQRDYNALLQEIFAPITDELNLTNEQKLKIAAIVTGTILKADPLYDQLDQLDDQLCDAAFLVTIDETKIRRLADEEGQLMTRIITMKTLAKVRMVQLLTPEQRTLIAQRLGSKSPPEAKLGAISNQ